MTFALTLGAVNGDSVDGCAVCDVKTVGKLDGAAVAAADGFSVRGERAGSGTEKETLKASFLYLIPMILIYITLD